jgi:cytochrome c oxidase subunit 2
VFNRHSTGGPRRRAGRAGQVLMLAAMTLVLAGCDSAKWARGGWPAPVTLQGERALKLWQGSLIAAACVGGFVIFLILFSAVAFRRRGNALPRQVRYNLPIEIAYTVVPTIIVAVMFYFTAIDEDYIDKLTPNPPVVVHVVGFQWGWQFNYVSQGLQITGSPNDLPTLTIPTGKRIRFILTSPDVVHSFWVIPFLFKRDVIPGRENQFEVTVIKTGWFAGKCTELCGVDHDEMLFTVHAVSWANYQTFLKRTKALAATGSNPMYALVPTNTIQTSTT